MQTSPFSGVLGIDPGDRTKVIIVTVAIIVMIVIIVIIVVQ